MRDGHQLALCLLGTDIRSELLQQQIAQLSPITGRILVSSFTPNVPLMRRFTQECHRVGDLLGVTAPHKGEVVTDQGFLGMDIVVPPPNGAALPSTLGRNDRRSNP